MGPFGFLDASESSIELFGSNFDIRLSRLVVFAFQCVAFYIIHGCPRRYGSKIQLWILQRIGANGVSNGQGLRSPP